MLTVYADVTGRANFHFHWRVDKAMLLNTLTDELNSPGKGRVGYPPFPFFAKLLIRRDLAAEVSVKSSNETGYRQNPHSIALICHAEVGAAEAGGRHHQYKRWDRVVAPALSGLFSYIWGVRGVDSLARSLICGLLRSRVVGGCGSFLVKDRTGL
jgi:hypothetical protein